MTDIAEAHAQMLRDGTIQLRFPDAAPPPPPPPEKTVHWPWAAIIDWLFWPVVIGGGLLLLLLLFQFLRTRPWQRTPRARPAAKAAPEPPPGVPPGPDDEALARDGRFEEAVHARLLRCVRVIAARHTLRPADTSRDIGGLAPLRPEWRAAFRAVAEPAERALFAQQRLDAADWEACRAASAPLLETEPAKADAT